MRVRALVAVLSAATLMMCAMVAGVQPATASTGARATAATDADFEFVLWLAQYDEQAMVRSTAWNALDPHADDAAIQRFFETEWESARTLAADRRARNQDFVAYVLETCVPDYSPEVCAAARFVSWGSDADREEFVVTGYEAAKLRDKQFRDATGEQAAALVKADRAFVALLRDTDPGPQVRAAAAWALRAGADDSDLVEFFTYGWAYAAGLDVRAYRTALADNEADWRRDIRQLLADARAAEQAARETAGEAAEQARAAAARAWAEVGQSTGPARTAWQQAEQVAQTQAETWRQVVAAAAAADSPNWTPMIDVAGTMGTQWDTERAQAEIQAAYWTGLYEQALAAETTWSAPAA